MARKPALNFSYQSDHNIWKIHAFKESAYLILEVRDQEAMSVSFVVIDLVSYQIVADKIVLEEQWWVSVAQAAGSEILFYTFDAENNPEVKEYVAFDVNDNKQLWTKDSLQIGEYIKERSSSNNELIIPFHYQSGSSYFKTVETFIETFLNEKITRAVDYREIGDKVLVSYFVANNQKLVNKLLVLDHEQNVLLHEILGIFEGGITDNTFFIINNTLIFVKGVTNFLMYDLNT